MLSHSFAIVPAAGRSTRMGTDKRTLPWRGKSLIQCVIDAWLQSRVDAVVIVTRPDDFALHQTLRSQPVELVIAETPPAEMKHSIQLGLEHLHRQWQPTDLDRWLLAPADMPYLTASLIDTVIDAATHHEQQIVVPTFHGRRGHPVVFPWSTFPDIRDLPAGAGVNAIVDRNPVIELPVQCDDCLIDVDRPDDYARLQAREVDKHGGSASTD